MYRYAIWKGIQMAADQYGFIPDQDDVKEIVAQVDPFDIPTTQLRLRAPSNLKAYNNFALYSFWSGLVAVVITGCLYLISLVANSPATTILFYILLPILSIGLSLPAIIAGGIGIYHLRFVGFEKGTWVSIVGIAFGILMLALTTVLLVRGIIAADVAFKTLVNDLGGLTRIKTT
jgi:hypothetical protein